MARYHTRPYPSMGRNVDEGTRGMAMKVPAHTHERMGTLTMVDVATAMYRQERRRTYIGVWRCMGGNTDEGLRPAREAPRAAPLDHVATLVTQSSEAVRRLGLPNVQASGTVRRTSFRMSCSECGSRGQTS